MGFVEVRPAEALEAEHHPDRERLLAVACDQATKTLPHGVGIEEAAAGKGAACESLLGSAAERAREVPGERDRKSDLLAAQDPARDEAFRGRAQKRLGQKARAVEEPERRPWQVLPVRRPEGEADPVDVEVGRSGLDGGGHGY